MKDLLSDDFLLKWGRCNRMHKTHKASERLYFIQKWKTLLLIILMLMWMTEIISIEDTKEQELLFDRFFRFLTVDESLFKKQSGGIQHKQNYNTSNPPMILSN